MAELQHLPYLGTAEDDVLFVEWLVDVGMPVRPGQAVATVETLKAAFEVEATHAGFLLRRLCAAGDRIGARAAIAVVGQSGEPCGDDVVQALVAPVAAPAAPAAPLVQAALFAAGGPARPVAPAARRRAAELGVDVDAVSGSGKDGLVRIEDVERAHAVRSAAAPVAGVAIGATVSDGAVDPEFLALVRKDLAAFAALSSDLKVALYRRHGARLGKDCHLGAGAVLLAEHIALGDGAYLGAGTSVEARTILAGALLHFGARCRVRTTALRFGDNAFFTEDVEIGGGGAMDPEAELVVGSHGFVGEHVHLNPCRTLRIGDEVVISRSACVMTHSFGPSWLQGYPSRFAGVEIGDGAQIGIGAVLFPGVAVGAGAVVLSGSSVVTSVPAGRLFGGVPAVDLKAAAQQLTPAEVAARARELVAEFARQLRLRGFDVHDSERQDCVTIEVRKDGVRHVLELAGELRVPAAAVGDEVVAVGIACPDAVFAAVPEGVTAIALAPPRVRGPLGPLAAAFREFLRKRGVRLHPRVWAYTGGWL